MAFAERNPLGNESALRSLAERQFGVFSHAQALEAGVSPSGMTRRVANEVWERVLPKVYRIVGVPSPREQRAMAAALWAGEGAVISHATAARLVGIEGVRERKIELWVPFPRNPRHPLVDVHRGTRVDRADRHRRGTLPITTPVRTLIDLSARMEDEPLLTAMESAFRTGLMTPDRLAARLRALTTSGRPGAGRLERLLLDRGDDPAAESRLETKVWLLLRDAPVPTPRRQSWVSTPGGRYRLDFAWPELKLALECDGWAHHGTRVAFGKDRERLSELAAMGWRVLVVTWPMATRQPQRVLRWVELALAA
ncbi:MAG TPA: DUF559 domain-containing protein [Acidimicrobiia bacterium]|nr:DUF559 domain-containing protein [Acidimicrobiia bacterium]